jgi:indole-3-acetate monooxygenase
MANNSGLAVELDGAAILTNARALDSRLRELAAESERRRRLVPEAVEALRTAGAFRIAMPRSWGGPETPLSRQIEIIEALSRADGSAGWCAMIGSVGGFQSSLFPDDVAREIWPDLDVVTAGFIFPRGRLVPDGDGFRLSGRWVFGSGCTHADVIAAGALVFDADGRAPVIGPGGRPDSRVAVLPADAVEIVDTWHSTGLAGSGSHDYAAQDVYVPAARVSRFDGEQYRDTPLYTWRGAFFVNVLGVPLGIARDAIDAAVPILADKVVLPERTKAKDDPRVRTAVARAEALVGSARSYCFDVVGDAWATLEAGDIPGTRQRAAVASAYVHVFQSCKEAVQLLCDAVGSASVYRSCPLDRHLRDMITISQHLLAQVKLYDAAGKLWFGEEPGLPGL